MQVITGSITLAELKSTLGKHFTDMIKGVVDVEKNILAIDAELHADLEALLIREGSRQRDLWGINLYPDVQGDDFVEFDSMINMRPSQGNRSRGVESPQIQKTIRDVVAMRIQS